MDGSITIPDNAFFSYMEDLLLHQNHTKIYTYVQTSYPKSQSNPTHICDIS